MWKIMLILQCVVTCLLLNLMIYTHLVNYGWFARSCNKKSDLGLNKSKCVCNCVATLKMTLMYLLFSLMINIILTIESILELFESQTSLFDINGENSSSFKVTVRIGNFIDNISNMKHPSTIFFIIFLSFLMIAEFSLASSKFSRLNKKIELQLNSVSNDSDNLKNSNSNNKTRMRIIIYILCIVIYLVLFLFCSVAMSQTNDGVLWTVCLYFGLFLLFITHLCLIYNFNSLFYKNIINLMKANVITKHTNLNTNNNDTNSKSVCNSTCNNYYNDNITESFIIDIGRIIANSNKFCLFSCIITLINFIILVIFDIIYLFPILLTISCLFQTKSYLLNNYCINLSMCECCQHPCGIICCITCLYCKENCKCNCCSRLCKPCNYCWYYPNPCFLTFLSRDKQLDSTSSIMRHHSTPNWQLKQPSLQSHQSHQSHESHQQHQPHQPHQPCQSQLQASHQQNTTPSFQLAFGNSNSNLSSLKYFMPNTSENFVNAMNSTCNVSRSPQIQNTHFQRPQLTDDNTNASTLTAQTVQMTQMAHARHKRYHRPHLQIEEERDHRIVDVNVNVDVHDKFDHFDQVRNVDDDNNINRNLNQCPESDLGQGQKLEHELEPDLPHGQAQPQQTAQGPPYRTRGRTVSSPQIPTIEDANGVSGASIPSGLSHGSAPSPDTQENPSPATDDQTPPTNGSCSSITTMISMTTMTTMTPVVTSPPKFPASLFNGGIQKAIGSSSNKAKRAKLETLQQLEQFQKLQNELGLPGISVGNHKPSAGTSRLTPEIGFGMLRFVILSCEKCKQNSCLFCSFFFLSVCVNMSLGLGGQLLSQTLVDFELNHLYMV